MPEDSLEDLTSLKKNAVYSMYTNSLINTHVYPISYVCFIYICI